MSKVDSNTDSFASIPSLSIQRFRCHSDSPKILTFEQFSALEPAIPVSRLRQLYFQSKPRVSSRGLIAANGYESAFAKIGARIYVVVNEFWNCVEIQNRPESIRKKFI